MNKKGYVDVLDIMLLIIPLAIFCILIGVTIYFFRVQLPLDIAKRDYLLKHPEQIVVSELQRGGELPKIPDLNVNIKSNETK